MQLSKFSLIVLFCSFLFIRECLCSSQMNKLDLSYVSFTKDHIFYVSQQKHEFGIMMKNSGMVKNVNKLKSFQKIIKINKQNYQVVIRKQKQTISVLNTKEFRIQEIDIEISFQHQQIIDYLQINNSQYLLTQKDVRIYDKRDLQRGQTLKNIFISGRKNQYFKRIFLEAQKKKEEMLLILYKNHQLCTRTFKTPKGQDRCHFKINYDIKNIQKLNNQKILISSENINYLIHNDLTHVQAINGRITQINGDYLILGQDFSSYDTKSQRYIKGLIVEGSSEDNIFLLHEISKDEISLIHNENEVVCLNVSQKPLKSWMNVEGNKILLLLQFGQFKLSLYQIQISKQNSSISIFQLWTKQSEPTFQQL